MKAIVASQNQVKADAAADALQTFCSQAIAVELATKPIDSGVNDQPMSLEETATGALNRLDAIKNIGDYAYRVAIEGGVYKITLNSEEKWFESACAAISSRDQAEPVIAFGPAYPIPKRFVPHLLDGQDLNEAMRLETGLKDIGKLNGFNGWLTQDQLDRRAASTQAVLLALHSLGKNDQ